MNQSYTQHEWSTGKIIVFVVVIVGIFVGYNYFSLRSAGAAEKSETATSTPSVGAGVIDKTLLAILDRIEAIKLDDKVFTDVAFTSLSDFTVTIVPQPIGRNNPFAPLGNSAKTSTPNQQR